MKQKAQTSIEYILLVALAVVVVAAIAMVIKALLNR
ncbi:TPA: class III signal peptide-containing protein [Candidatus Micrarchaeota archaeon]|nr:class III signal peptide-containing protein [Candidatus Micrarchaeota archaeon]